LPNNNETHLLYIISLLYYFLNHLSPFCYNCDEPYVRGHKCSRLFYLEVSDYIVEEPEDAANETAAEPVPFDPETPMISLNAIAIIRTKDTMQVYITIGNDQFIALLDSGSTHNFVRGDMARRVGLQF
jgi:hypothetical protein